VRPRAAALEAVRAGHDLHYPGESGPGDHALLDGDRLYAQGLDALAAAGDLEGVRALAALITACARAHAEGRPADAAAAWREAEARFG
jgi:hypothetical protein